MSLLCLNNPTASTLKEVAPIEDVQVSLYRIPTDLPESDGTFVWDQTTMIAVRIKSCGKTGLGWTYGHQAVAEVITESFVPFLEKANAFQIPFLWECMVDEVRNTGWRGIASHAISAIDIALWDLKAKILCLPLCLLWGQVKEGVPVYGSGGFTSYTGDQLKKQFENWRRNGIRKFKMKVGRRPDQDLERVRQAREIIGDDAELFVDANGAYTRKQAMEFAQRFREHGVCWFEEPVSSDDLDGLHLLRNHAQGIAIAAGEYGYDMFYFKRMLEAQAVDILQADATRCGGFTGFFQACQLSRAFNIQLSSHTAASLHLHACLHQRNVCHMEYFHDHVRIEENYFEGFPMLRDGCLYPHLERPGHGLKLKEDVINRFLI